MSSQRVSGSDDVYDVVTIGETMAAFVRDGDSYRATPIGAESNVAVGMAQLGCRARWVSRLGEDELGHAVSDFIAGHGVDVQVEWDTGHVTGVCVKEVTPDGTRVRYYRSQSAARLLSDKDLRHLGRARWVHVTGITPALSPAGAALIEKITGHRSGPAGRASFDFNYRPALWSGPQEAAETLLPLARAADTVFIGDDEAEALLGSSDEAEVRRRILSRDDQEVVLKRGPGPASRITLAGVICEPASPATVVDVTGAGDAFAAGYLAASCWDWPAAARLRLGHALGARVVTVKADLAPTLEKSEVDRLLAAVLRSTHDGERTA